MKISQLLYKKEKWTQNALARDKEGQVIPSLNKVHFFNGKEFDPAKEAYSFSLYGAAAHLFSGEGLQETLLKLGDSARKYSGKKIWLAEFNDDPSTSFEDIKKVLTIANL